MSEPLTEVEKKKIKLWTARDLLFAGKGSDRITIRKYTPCHKPPYDRDIKDRLLRMEKNSFNRPASKPKAVCVVLLKLKRYLWRTDVFTRKECEDAKRAERAATVRAFSKKPNRIVDKEFKDRRED